MVLVGFFFLMVEEEVETGRKERYQERKGRQREKEHKGKVKGKEGRKDGERGGEKGSKKEMEVYFLNIMKIFAIYQMMT